MENQNNLDDLNESDYEEFEEEIEEDWYESSDDDERIVNLNNFVAEMGADQDLLELDIFLAEIETDQRRFNLDEVLNHIDNDNGRNIRYYINDIKQNTNAILETIKNDILENLNTEYTDDPNLREDQNNERRKNFKNESLYQLKISLNQKSNDILVFYNTFLKAVRQGGNEIIFADLSFFNEEITKIRNNMSLNKDIIDLIKDKVSEKILIEKIEDDLIATLYKIMITNIERNPPEIMFLYDDFSARIQEFKNYNNIDFLNAKEEIKNDSQLTIIGKKELLFEINKVIEYKKKREKEIINSELDGIIQTILIVPITIPNIDDIFDLIRFFIDPIIIELKDTEFIEFILDTFIEYCIQLLTIQSSQFFTNIVRDNNILRGNNLLKILGNDRIDYFIKSSIQNNKGFNVLKYGSFELKRNIDFIDSVINSRNWNWYDDEINNDYDLVRSFILIDGMNLRYASENLKKNKYLSLLALKNESDRNRIINIIELINPGILLNHHFMREAVENNDNIFTIFKNEFNHYNNIKFIRINGNKILTTRQKVYNRIFNHPYNYDNLNVLSEIEIDIELIFKIEEFYNFYLTNPYTEQEMNNYLANPNENSTFIHNDENLNINLNKFYINFLNNLTSIPEKVSIEEREKRVNFFNNLYNHSVERDYIEISNLLDLKLAKLLLNPISETNSI